MADDRPTPRSSGAGRPGADQRRSDPRRSGAPRSDQPARSGGSTPSNGGRSSGGNGRTGAGRDHRHSQGERRPAGAPRHGSLSEEAPLVTAEPAPHAGATTFAELGVPAALCAVLDAQSITAPFSIQSATIPDALVGRDVLGRGRTGSGKTLAFGLPLIARLVASKSPRRPGRPRALILAPTRELVSQIQAVLEPLAAAVGLRTTIIFGGVGANPQIRALRAGVDIVIACPGRLEDHMRGRECDLANVEVTVLDEADHMADLGFLPVVQRILDATPKDTQRLLFSATLDRGIDGLVKRYLNAPVVRSVDEVATPVGDLAHHVLHVNADDRLAVLVDLTAAPGRTIVFTRTKHGAKKLAKLLTAAGVPAVELHGNLAQNARERNLAAFHAGEATALVATDIAARGIHVDDVTLVIHADPPVEHKAYLHRSGRTARAGAAGTVVTLATSDQMADVRDLTKKAAISPTTTRLTPGHPLLAELAPGERTFRAFVPPVAPAQPQRRPQPRQGAPRSDARGGGRPRRSGGAGGSGRPAGSAAR